MLTDNYEQIFTFGKSALNPLNAIGKTFVDLGRRASQEVFEITGDNLTRAAEQFKRLSTVRKPDEWVNFQKEYFNENVNAFMENCQKWLNLSLGGFEEINKSFNTQLKDQQSANKASSSERNR